MRILSLTLLTSLALAAQQVPDAAVLLERSANALKSYGTFEYTEVMSGLPGGMDTTMLHQGTSSGKMRMSQKIGDTAGVLLISDGQNTWMYMAMMKRYTKMPAESGAAETIAGHHGGGKAGAKVLRSETLDVEGEPHDCWVVESHVAASEASFGGANVKGGTQTNWIDKTTGIELKSVTTTSIQMPGNAGPMDMTTTMSRRGFKFNIPLDDSLFVFTPPAGAVETGELFPGMKAITAKTETPSARVPGVAEPHAYVPNLSPIEQVEPVRPRGVVGQANVRLLLTINAAGTVLHAEPLTGPEVFRKAAIDAVEQWRFEPVIRDGSPVSAYTDAFVSFFDNANKSPEAEVPDMREEMEGVERLRLLQERFPRTAAQELADLEQDLHGRAPDHSFQLPALAKAALKANATDKATAYANDLLHTSASDPMSGQAVYDGNAVLGALALQRNDIESAKHYLLESGKTKGSPALDSFGPNMLLAKLLLEKGERAAVLEFFESCRAFWKMGTSQLDSWSAVVRNGGMPAFGANLLY
jgi:outer membrane lipoprotein-sorting protein